MSRFSAHPAPDGLLVLDTSTGEVVLVPHDGSPPVVRRPALASPSSAGQLHAPLVPPSSAGQLHAPAAPASSPGRIPAPAAPASSAGPLSTPKPWPPSASPTPAAAAPPAQAAAAMTPGAAHVTPRAHGGGAAGGGFPASGIAPVPAMAAGAPAEPLDELDRVILATYPLPVARAYRRYVEEHEPRQRCRLLVDTFTCVLKLWALQVASEYLRVQGLHDSQVHDLLTRDFQRPLISAWSLMVHRGLSALRRAEVAPFAPELLEAYDELERRCREPVVVRVRYEDVDGVAKYKKSKLGKIQALIRYRNGLAHGFDQSLDKAHGDLERYAPILRDVLRAARFMGRRPLVHLRPCRDGEGAEGWRLMGLQASPGPERFARVELPRDATGSVYLLDEGRAEALPLHYFADVSRRDDEAWDVLLFEGSTRSTVVYVSADGEHVEKQSRAKEIGEVLGRRSPSDRLVPLSRLSLEELMAASERSSERALSALADSGRWLADATVARRSAEAHLDRFLHGDYRAFVLTGEGGSGKTSLLARTAQSRLQAGDAVVFISAATLVDADLPARILRDLGVRGAYLEDFLAAADAAFREAPERRLIVVVDALNEHPGDTSALVRSLDAIVAQMADYPFARIVTSVRRAAYERLPSDARFGRAPGASYYRVEESRGASKTLTPLVPLGWLEDDELERAYEAYRELRTADPYDPVAEPIHRFRPRTPVDELERSGTTHALLRDPMMLRLVMEAHHRRPLPSQLAPDRAVALFFESVVLGRSGQRRGHPERGVVLRALTRELDAASTDAVLRDRLYAVDALRAALTNPQKDSPYVQLLDLGVLAEEWDDDRCRVRFSQSGLFEYLLAELHEQRVETPADVLRVGARARSFRSLRAALVLVLRRAAEVDPKLLTQSMHAAERGEDEDLADLIARTVRDAVIDLARYRSAAFAKAVDALAEDGTPRELELLVQTTDRLFVLGETEHSEAMADATERVARAEGDRRLLAAALVARGRVAHRLGEAERAEQILAEARGIALEAGETLESHRIDVLRAMIAVQREDRGRARELYEAAELALEAAEAFAELSEVKRGRALLVGREGDGARERQLLREATELAERADDRSSLAKAHNNLAASYVREGRFRDAEKHFVRARQMHAALGARTSVAIAELNLGALYYRDLLDFQRAEASYRSAEDIFAAAQHVRGEAAAITSRAALAMVQGRSEEAIEQLDEVLPRWSRTKDTMNTAYTVYLRAMAGLDAGRPPERVEELARRHAELAEKVAVASARLHGAALALRLAVRARPEEEPDVSALLQALEASGGGCAPEDGASTALTEAAEAALATGALRAARSWAIRALELAGDAPFVGRDRAARIIGDADAATPSSKAGRDAG